ncbi:MAG: hypothetical protein KDJ68_15815 [Rhodobiaceae bacterium]|nr:hypothetical protein [Rhodobiaceae bacterium]
MSDITLITVTDLVLMAFLAGAPGLLVGAAFGARVPGALIGALLGFALSLALALGALVLFVK